MHKRKNKTDVVVSQECSSECSNREGGIHSPMQSCIGGDENWRKCLCCGKDIHWSENKLGWFSVEETWRPETVSERNVRLHAVYYSSLRA